MSKVRLERRRSERAELLVRVDYATVDELFSEFTRDINEGGLFIETERPRPAGTVVSMQFHLPGGEEPVRTQGRVVRVVPPERGQRGEVADASPPGMGIEFDELTDEARRRIDQMVRALRSGALAPREQDDAPGAALSDGQA